MPPFCLQLGLQTFAYNQHFYLYIIGKCAQKRKRESRENEAEKAKKSAQKWKSKLVQPAIFNNFLQKACKKLQTGPSPLTKKKRHGIKAP